MWQPTKLKIEKLFSHVDTEYEFRKNQCVMIYGENETDPGSDSNGSGKSGLIEAITLAVTGETNRGVKKDQFITDGEEETYVQFDLTNQVCDIKTLSIRRWFHIKRSSKIELWENGTLNKQITSVLEANKRILELIGLTREDFLHFFVIGQDTNYSFLTTNDVEKKNIIARFSNTEFISQKVETLKELNKEHNQELAKIKSKVEKFENKIEFIDGQIADEKENFLKRLETKISGYTTQIEKYKSEIGYKETRLKDLRQGQEHMENEVLETKNELKNTDELYEEIEKLKVKISKAKKVRRKLRDEKDETEHLITHLENIQKGKLSCPECEYEFNPSANVTLEEVPELLEAAEVNMESFDYDTKALNERIEMLDKKVSKIEKEINLADKFDQAHLTAKRNLKRHLNTMETLEDEISGLERSIKSNDDIITKLKESANKDEKIVALRAEKKLTSQLLSETTKEMLGWEEKIGDNEFWIYHFGKKGFMTFLTNKSIKSIEGITNSYLKKINTDLQVNIDGFTVLKSGDIREKIDVSIIRNGKNVGIYDRYSGGEKGRINLANIAGMQKLFNMSAPNGGLNFLGLDEVFEGLDVTGQKDLIKILENLGVTTLVVSHRNTPIGANNELIIKKVNGISILKKS